MSAISSPVDVSPAIGAPKRPVRRRTITRRGFTISVLAYGVALIFLLPYLEMIVSALRPANQLLAPNLLPSHFSFRNFTTIWSTGFGGNLGESLQIAGGATVLVLLVAIPAAYYSARHRFRGRSLFLLLVLATQMLQPAAMLVGIQREFSSFNLPPTLSLILVNAGFNMAFAVWILNAYFSSIPVELEEAAMIDGCTRVGAFFRITFPLVGPGLVATAVFGFIQAWNEYIIAYVLLSSPGNQTLTVWLASFTTNHGPEWGPLMAAATLTGLPVVAFFLIVQRYLAGGMTAGAIKG